MENKTKLPGENERRQYNMLLLSVKEVKSRNGSIYCILELQPSADERKITAKMWNTDKAQITKNVPEMSVASLFLKGEVYEGNLQFIADTISPGTGKPENYLPASKIDGQKMYDYLIGFINKHCGSHPATKAVLSIYEENREKLISYPAAMNIHHAYNGGLLMHTGTCSCICYKLASAVSPEVVREAQSADVKMVMNKIFSMLKKSASGPVTDAAKKIFLSFHTTHKEEAVEKYITMLVLQKFSKSYPFLDNDLLFGACAMRGLSVFVDDPMAELVGPATADMLLIKKGLAEAGLDTEKARLLRHCMIVSNQTTCKGAIPEAYLLVNAEEIARAAIKNAMADDADYEVSTAVISAALHDIGKLRELDATPLGKTEYHVDGNLFGHSAMGIEMYIEALEKTETPFDEATGSIAACIASHHGKSEWGALTEPASFEAWTLFMVDRIDSRMDIFERCAQALDEGGRDESVRKYIGNVVYKPAKTAQGA